MGTSLARSLWVNFSIFGYCLAQMQALAAEPDSENVMQQLTGVRELADVQPTDWAYQAVQSLSAKYDCLAGYPQGEFRGQVSISRLELAAGIQFCVQQLNQRFQDPKQPLVDRESQTVITRLQTDFGTEIIRLSERVSALELQSDQLAAQQFSPTTKLSGQVVMAIDTGTYTGTTLLDPTGTAIANPNPNATVIYRVSLDLDSSFTGSDLLKMRLAAASGGANDNAGAVLEPNFGSGLDFSSKPPSTGQFEIVRLHYTFRPLPDLSVTIAPEMRITDYVDRNRYANLGHRDFSTEAMVNNYILFPISGPSSGAIVTWNPNNGPFTLRALYSAADAANPSNQGLLKGTAPFVRLIYPIVGNPATADLGARGLFGESYQGMVEAQYSPSNHFTLRLQYNGGEVFAHRFDVAGINVEWALAKDIGIMGRYGYGSYDQTRFGNINPQYWMAAIVLRNLLYDGSSTGLGISQPFMTGAIGNATQTNFEMFYTLPINRWTQITPMLQVVTNPSNQSSNSPILTGTVRTVFSF